MRKVLAMLLAVMLLCTVLPMAALAEDCEGEGAQGEGIERAHEHNYTWNDLTPATCESAGKEIGTCWGCGNTIVQENPDKPALGHNWKWRETIVGRHVQTCTNCGKEQNRGAHTHSGATCTSPDVCTACGKQFSGKLGHDMTVYHEAKNATCVDGGWDAYYTCSRCGQAEDHATYGPTGIHDMTVPVAGTPATCEGTGIPDHNKCSVCGKEEEYSPIPALDHKWTLTDSKEVTCTEDGYADYVCDNDPSHTKHEDFIHEGHVCNDWEVTTPPSCIWEGTQTGTCEKCGELLKGSIPATGVCTNFDEWEVVTAPTCTEKGLRKHTCQDCFTEYTEEMPPEHSLTTVPKKEASCTEDGHEEYQKCSNCDYSTPIVVIPGRHTFGPDYSKNNEEHWYSCSVCGQLDKDSLEKHLDSELYSDGSNHWKVCPVCDEFYAKSSHNKIVDVKAKDPSCEEDGCTEGWHCDFCGYTVESKPIDMTMHKYVTVAGTEPTCTESGWTEGVQCAYCDYWKLAPVEILPNGHEASDWIDCEDGKHHIKVCERCGEHIDRGHHDWHKGEKHWGHTHYYCDDCGAEKKVNNHYDHHEYNDGSNPKTSDDSNIFTWVVVMSVSAVALVGTSVYGLKKRNQ